jgi:hypothetical protein
MFKKVTRILGVIALTGWMGVANATLIFDFSWDSSNGKVTGEIFGLVDNRAGQAASSILITSVAGITLYRPDWDILDVTYWIPQNNYFDVSAGRIVGYNVFVSFTPDAIKMSSTGGGYFGLGAIPGRGRYDDRSTSLRHENSLSDLPQFVNRVTVPEPSSVILMLLGLAGLSFTRYRRQS